MRFVHLLQVAAESGGAGIGAGAVARFARAEGRDDGGHDLGGGFQVGVGGGLGCDAGDAPGGIGVELKRLGSGKGLGLVELADHVQQGIMGFFGFDLLARQIGGGHIRARMAVEADGFQVQEDGFAAGADILGGLLRDFICLVDIKAVGVEILQAGAVFEGIGDPAGGGFGRDANAVVLADEQQRQGEVLVSRPARSVERPLRGGMVGRGVAKAAVDNGIIWKLGVLGAVFLGSANGIGSADGFGQVGSDGRGLRRDVQRFAAQNLVATARDRVIRRGCEGQKHVISDGLPRHLARAGDLKSSIAVVQEGHIGGAQGEGDRREALMARRADGVKASALALHFA